MGASALPADPRRLPLPGGKAGPPGCPRALRRGGPESAGRGAVACGAAGVRGRGLGRLTGRDRACPPERDEGNSSSTWRSSDWKTEVKFLDGVFSFSLVFWRD